MTDPASGAFSRALLDVRLVEEIGRARRAGADFSVCLLDVDHFKSVNDAFGHARGDQVLRQVVERINEHLRDSDAVFRFGGDEFVLLLAGADKSRATDVAVRIVESVAGSSFAGEPPLQVSISLGIACWPQDADDAEELLAVADRRSYLAKHRGRGCVVVDDNDTAVGTAAGRLLERDAALAAAHAFLAGVAASNSATLRVSGQRGAGHSRFLDEIAHLAAMRAFEVIWVRAQDGPERLNRFVEAHRHGEAGGQSGGGRVLVVADGESLWQAAAEVAREKLRGCPAAAVGVVLAGPDSAIGPVTDDLPLRQVVELGPWSGAAVRVWLRTSLRGEPSSELVTFICARSGGLPARAERTLKRLVEDGRLRATSTGWTFEAPHGAAARERTLPAPLTELVGRGAEIDRVIALLGRERLLTLTGPGGVGKTRLAVAVAAAIEDRFEDGAVFVGLSECVTAHQAESTVARALGVSEVPGQALSETIAHYLATRELLLVLDNFEQVLPGAAHVGQWLQAAPRVAVLATSRERLRLSAERVYAVPGLTLPPLDALPQCPYAASRMVAESSALHLFAARAQRVDYDFAVTPRNLPAVAELCQRLDTLPLAIELAAAHVDTMSPQRLLTRLGERLDLTGPLDSPARQQTLRATIGWSYDLLAPPERALFTALGVFAGGARLEAIAAVWPTEGLPELLATLVQKNLLRAGRDPDGETRYLMLDTIGADATQRLAAAPEGDALKTAHAAYYADFAEPAWTERLGAEGIAFLDLMEREHHNICAALAWTLQHGDIDTAARIAIGVWRFWGTRGYGTEGRQWLDQLLASREQLPAALRWKVLYGAAALAAVHSDVSNAVPLAEESLHWGRRVDEPGARRMALRKLGQIVSITGDVPRAQTLARESLGLATAEGDDRGIARALSDLSVYAIALSEMDEARDLVSRSLELVRAAGDTSEILVCVTNLGEITIHQKDTAAARALFEEGLELTRKLGDARIEAYIFHQLGVIAQIEGDTEQAAHLFTVALTLRDQAHELVGVAESLEGVAGVTLRTDAVFAARLFGAADAVRRRHDLPRQHIQQQQWEAHTSMLRDLLDDDVREAAWASGFRAPLDTVVTQALKGADASYPTSRDSRS